MTREEAIEIAKRCAAAKPESYYAEPFQPHEWVIDAIMEVGTARDACIGDTARTDQLHMGEIARLDVELAKARAVSQAMRTCIVYARDRRGNAFDFDTWIQLVESALAHGTLPPHAVEEAQGEALMYKQALDAVRTHRDLLLRELAEQYPIAITARAVIAGEVTESEAYQELRQIITKIGNSTEAAKLEYLPTRLRGTNG